LPSLGSARGSPQVDEVHEKEGFMLQRKSPPALAEYGHTLAEFNTNNAFSLRKLRDEGRVKILKFDDSLLKAFAEISKDIVATAGSGDELSKKIYRSYEQFRASILGWTDISERAYLNSRSLAG
jgi:TRAP-type mannitol/chloroaromatic compound transport system substrate-binding protein